MEGYFRFRFPRERRTVEEVFKDFEGRRSALIRALTTDVEEFHRQCDPKRKECLCLYGFPDGQWVVTVPTDEIPLCPQEPLPGINCPRDRMKQKDWLSWIAEHCDVWLLAVAFYFGSWSGFDKAQRERLYDMINDLPTVSHVISGTDKRQEEEETAGSEDEEDETDSEEAGSEEVGSEGEKVCGVCGERELWICCSICKRRFHGECVGVPSYMATFLTEYTCPSCSKPSFT